MNFQVEKSIYLFIFSLEDQTLYSWGNFQPDGVDASSSPLTPHVMTDMFKIRSRDVELPTTPRMTPAKKHMFTWEALIELLGGRWGHYRPNIVLQKCIAWQNYPAAATVSSS